MQAQLQGSKAQAAYEEAAARGRVVRETQGPWIWRIAPQEQIAENLNWAALAVGGADVVPKGSTDRNMVTIAGLSYCPLK